MGPTKDKLTPKIKNTALILWSIYIGFSVLQTILLLLGGLNPYDAVTITFSTMAAAGFCVKNSSIGTFGSAYVDIVVTLFMLVSGANFALYYKALSGKISSVLKDGELRVYLGIWAVVSLLAALKLFSSNTYDSFAQSLRYSAFQTASILTTTGFATANYINWPAFSQVLLLLLFFVGGSAGSAGGGVLSRLALAPGRQAQIAQTAMQRAIALAQFTGSAMRGQGEPVAPQAAGTPYANRFADPAWAKFPFNVLAQSFITAAELAREAVSGAPGADAAALNVVGFTLREGLELLAPDNYLPTNPQLLGQTRAEGGRNLVRGVKYLICLLYTSPSPRDRTRSRMPSSA